MLLLFVSLTPAHRSVPVNINVEKGMANERQVPLNVHYRQGDLERLEGWGRMGEDGI